MKMHALDRISSKGKPRGTAEITRFVQAHIMTNNMVVSDGWSATKAVNWTALGLRYEYCVHSRQLGKGFGFQKKKKGLRELEKKKRGQSSYSWSLCQANLTGMWYRCFYREHNSQCWWSFGSSHVGESPRLPQQ